MNLKQFASEAGVQIVRCDITWGGTFGYRTKDSPSTFLCGYKTEEKAYKAWLKNSFGDNLAKAITKLLDK